MGIMRLIIILCAIPTVVSSETLALECSGTNPDWTLSYDEETARFAFLDRESDLQVPQKSTAEGVEWPKAATLVGPRDSAIIILHNRQCGTEEYELQILTQRGESPILLTGCCSRQ